MVNSSDPEYLLFAQHGWADTGKDIGRLVNTAADPQTKVIVPSLGLIKTFIRLEPLVRRLEQIAMEVINLHPLLPIKIVGHSMGGLMWLEVLERNPQWWHKIHSFILLGSPVGGSNVARIIDPWGMGIGTAGDLGKNRRPLAEKIAQQIPTLSVASDIGMGTDGLITVENTKFAYGNWLKISGITHNAMKYHRDIMPILQDFWANPQLGVPPEASLTNRLIQRLRAVPGMTDASYRNFERSQIVARLTENLENLTLHTWKNWLGVDHVYLGKQEQCLYGGYVGLIHAKGLHRVIEEIQQLAFSPNEKNF